MRAVSVDLPVDSAPRNTTRFDEVPVDTRIEQVPVGVDVGAQQGARGRHGSAIAVDRDVRGAERGREAGAVVLARDDDVGAAAARGWRGDV